MFKKKTFLVTVLVTAVLTTTAFAVSYNYVADEDEARAIPGPPEVNQPGFLERPGFEASPPQCPAVAGEKKAGETTYDYQQNGSQGNRVIPYPAANDTCVHLCWMYSVDEDAAHSSRAVYWNVYSNTSEGFLAASGGKVSGAYKAGYTNMNLLSDGRAVVAFHQSPNLGADYVTMVAVEAAPGVRVFNTPVVVGSNPPPGTYGNPCWPRILVDSDDVIHVWAHIFVQHPDNPPALLHILYYSRSTDMGMTFSDWVPLTQVEEEENMMDPAVAVSPDGSRIGVALVDFIDPDAWFGHISYIESTDGGDNWSEPVNLTAGRYPADFPMDDTAKIVFASFRDVDIAFDDDNNLHVVFVEGLYNHKTDDAYYFYPSMAARCMHYGEASGQFSRVSGYFGTYMWTKEEGTVLDTVLYDGGWWGTDNDLWSQEAYCGLWKPQLTAGDGLIAVTFGGKREPWDMSIAGTINGDIYVAVSDDGGATWGPTDDFSYEQQTPDMDRHWWNAHKGCVTNITNTWSVDANPGQCLDEDYHTAWPYTTRDNIMHLTYIRDLFAGAAILGPTEGYYTFNPVIYLPYEIKKGTVTGTFNIDGTHYPNIGIEEEPLDNSASLRLIGSNVFTQSVSFSVSSPATQASLKIYDASGSLVKTLFEGTSQSHTLTWDGTSNSGDILPAGVYFYSFASGDITENGRLILLR